MRQRRDVAGADGQHRIVQSGHPDAQGLGGEFELAGSAVNVQVVASSETISIPSRSPAKNISSLIVPSVRRRITVDASGPSGSTATTVTGSGQRPRSRICGLRSAIVSGAYIMMC